jgi:hypothetical protein
LSRQQDGETQPNKGSFAVPSAVAGIGIARKRIANKLLQRTRRASFINCSNHQGSNEIGWENSARNAGVLTQEEFWLLLGIFFPDLILS